jgi:hypothetical protein
MVGPEQLPGRMVVTQLLDLVVLHASPTLAINPQANRSEGG